MLDAEGRYGGELFWIRCNELIQTRSYAAELTLYWMDVHCRVRNGSYLPSSSKTSVLLQLRDQETLKLQRELTPMLDSPERKIGAQAERCARRQPKKLIPKSNNNK